ncbi:hypothetical protein NVV94_12590 [Pseudomonas sp. LS1212]|nr:hypothetical protein [Pseudomonas sp. LS1212]UVJ46293.1 hypothetical protein NVV94_12590 [Pseudomonas sp. LS1212]
MNKYISLMLFSLFLISGSSFAACTSINGPFQSAGLAAGATFVA